MRRSMWPAWSPDEKKQKFRWSLGRMGLHPPIVWSSIDAEAVAAVPVAEAAAAVPVAEAVVPVAEAAAAVPVAEGTAT